ncbi:2-keto-4-pentenoate hydratase [Haloechinothrix sp. YIM 98757]|uniref:2-keto-4-pentenoate hydratase n=1 Tax=Haloechinothrix aidingensis TaxID=2752311 RepID=A0A838A5J7_9PSEU|nr:fumarylacetoacetate hydrolase family protein [Haloechinothrix aidingensis]MBA0124268.1 2-keto-4-pentenoate hydratase [Haloechinothrix aidingensis]
MTRTSTDTRVSHVARLLVEARQLREPCPPVRDELAEGDLDQAYAVQEAVIESLLRQGRHRVGRKIGLTSPAVQRQFGVYQPDFGMLLDDAVYADREAIPLAGFLQPRAEAEVAFVLGTDLDIPSPTVADVLRATEYLLPAIEIVDSRVAGWDIQIVDTVADNASTGAAVLGTTPVRPGAVDLVRAGMAMERTGTVVSTGAGAACLGSPVSAVTWLARTLARRGDPLRAGEVVLSGALGPMVPVVPARAATGYRARIHGLGEVHAVFTQEEGEVA